MFEPSEYQLVDFGGGRKLERFGSELLDRPSPAAAGATSSDPDLWTTATARFEVEQGGKQGGKGQWVESFQVNNAEPWSVRHGDSRLLMQLGASGNVGLFPEQASNWEWTADQVSQCRDDLSDRRPRVLNLFAYTGGASLAAALAGAEVTHVDSSGPSVTWAKRNAEASGAADLPIRWLVEDAMKYIAREVKRGNFYDGIIADPPTYGHGPKGKPFKFEQHLDTLLEVCGELLDHKSSAGRFLLFSCHAPAFGPSAAVSAVESVVPGADGLPVDGRPLVLETADGRALHAGVAARWSSTASELS